MIDKHPYDLTASNPNRQWYIQALCVIASIGSSLLFLPHQPLWADETTQLSGLNLGPIDVVRWLIGKTTLPRVVSDCMPPISYWVGMAWASAFGHTEQSIRYLSIFLTALSVVVIFRIAYSAYGIRSATMAGMLMALSPNVVGFSVGIRPYSLLLFEACCAFYCQMQLFKQASIGGQRKWLFLLSLCCLSTIYTHFFGIVFTIAIFLPTIAVMKIRGQKTPPTITAMGVLILCSVGLWPFILAGSTTHPATGMKAYEMRDVLRLIYRMVGHPAMALSNPVLILAFTAILTLLIGLRNYSVKSAPCMAAWALTIMLGILVPTCLLLAISRFNAAAPTYYIWLLPAFYLLLSSALNQLNQGPGKLTLCAAFVILSANAYGTTQLIRYGSYFVPGPQRQMIQLINSLGTSDTAVLYENSPGNVTGMLIFPLEYRFHEQLDQYTFDNEKMQARKIFSDSTPVAVDSISRKYMLVVRSRNETSQDIKQYITNEKQWEPDASMMLKSNIWKMTSHYIWIAFVAAEVEVYERIDLKAENRWPRNKLPTKTIPTLQ